ncbi:IS110 family transposase [Nocardioides okcheonensis]|uniref:IS110 family transposase n=1 Tax=Nocardioides okcheonensis TaxID=2894081 RepID=UPI0038B39F3D
MTVKPAEQVVTRQIIVGVDTHKYVHVAIALDQLGTQLAAQHVAANREGYAQLEAWAAAMAGDGRVSAYGVDGTGSYGVGLASFLRRTGHRVIEVNRGDRRSRRSNGKSDTLDAEAGARAVLGGQAGQGCPQVRRRRSRDDPADQNRPRHRPQSQDQRHHHLEGTHRHRTRRAARATCRPFRQGPHRQVRLTATRRGHLTDREHQALTALTRQTLPSVGSQDR